ncbi:MAG: YebC/PmpR family DNA-binding transcriptional regulator [Candidatus Sungbacteria bacterium]|nr:YebC/PmpR family DNA-binding transcriptional regulator [Candidatus Sungbacteria bacterium]
MSGHSKWAQIKHKKATADAKRGQLFSKLIREITIAGRAGGSNPDTNARLRSALERGRNIGLPKENIERALARTGGGGEGERLSEFLYEAVGPGGAAILIEGITDNKNRTLSEIRRLVSDSGGRLADQGSLAWNFEKIGTLEVGRRDNAGKRPEEIEIAFIDAGAKDFASGPDAWLVQTEFTRREEALRKLEERGITVQESGHDYVSRTQLRVSPEDRERIGLLYDALIGHDDVQEVYTNLAEYGKEAKTIIPDS